FTEQDSPQSVISAKFQDEYRRLILQKPIQAAQTSGSSFPAQASVDYFIIESQAVNSELCQSRKAVLRIDSISCGEAISKEENRFLWCLGLDRGGGFSCLCFLLRF